MKKKVKKKYRYGVKQPSGKKTLYTTPSSPNPFYLKFPHLTQTATSTNYIPNAYRSYTQSSIIISRANNNHLEESNPPQFALKESVWRKALSLLKKVLN